jgi:hypothetical protein
MRLTLPDDVGDLLEDLAQQAHTSVDDLVQGLLARTIHVPLRDRAVILYGESRERLEQVAGRPLQTPADVVQLVDRLAALDFGHIRLTLTTKHLEELARRAEKRGVSVPDLVAEIAAELEPQFFDRMSGFGLGYTPATVAAQPDGPA